jgi:RimJ/RimL family protein N-acetyltransferase
MPETEVHRSPGASGFFLRSERIGFRVRSDADFDLALGLWGDYGVTHLVGGPFSEEQIRARLGCEIATFRAHGMQYWPTFLLASGEHVGCCGIRPYRIEDRVYELGIHVRTAQWGQGYGQETARTVIGHAFDGIGASAVFAGQHPANAASRRPLLRLGFEYTHNEYYAPTRLNHPSYFLPSSRGFGGNL